MLLFTLSMPNVGSWNGKWTGEGRTYCRSRKVSRDKEKELDGKSFYYDFGDGWCANVSVKKVYANEAGKAMRKSMGFCGYEWMINEIVTLGKIKTLKERRQ